MNLRNLFIGIAILFILLLLGFGIWILFKQSPQTDVSVPFIDTAPSKNPFNRTPLPDPIPFPINSLDPDERDDRIVVVGSETSPDKQQTQVDSFPRIVRLFAGPSAGYRIDNETGTVADWVVRVVERGVGDRYTINIHPYSINLSGGGDFLRVREGHILKNGTTLILHEGSLGESILLSSIIPFDGGGVPRPFERDIVVTKNKTNSLLYVRPTTDSGSSVVLTSFDEGRENSRVLWRSGFRSWRPYWGNNDSIIIETPSSEFAEGFTYKLDPRGGGITDRLFGNIRGLGTLYDEASGFTLVYGERETKIVSERFEDGWTIPTTLPEKCAAVRGIFVCGIPNSIPLQTFSGRDTNLSDSWYQGDISFSDTLIAFDAVGKQVHPVIDFREREIQELTEGVEFDIIQPQLTPDGRLLFFVNKKDLSLWVVRL